MRARYRLTCLFVFLGLAGASSVTPVSARARNVILMIADGAGFNTWTVTSRYENREGRQVYDGAEWVRLAASVHPLRSREMVPVGAEFANVQIPALVYDPVRAWDTTAASGGPEAFPYHFSGYEWLRKTAPDSASTATALVSGRKTYDGAINVDGAGTAIDETLPRLAHDAGKRAGVVTSVSLSHATPAAVGGAHSPTRRVLPELTRAMLTGGILDVVIGCGHPGFDNNGAPILDQASHVYDHVGGQEVWTLISDLGDSTIGDWMDQQPAGHIDQYRRWTLVDDRHSIDALRRGATPEKLLVVPRVGEVRFWTGSSSDASNPLAKTRRMGATLQQQRGSRADPRHTPPGYDPEIVGVPSLAELTQVALNALDDDPEGFFLMVEGGAVDWAMHGNQAGRMIEEMSAFNRAVDAVVSWIRKNGGWEETLLVLTADHDHMFWGPSSHTAAFDPPGAGPDGMPSYRWLSTGHSNALVPLYARGNGARRLLDRIVGSDPFRGDYVDQVDIHEIMREALVGRR